MKKIIGFVLLLPMIAWGLGTAWMGYKAERDFLGYLKRAADANTVELARGELEKSVRYLEAHGMTNGSTALIFKKPSYDVAFWYANLSASLKELNELSPNATPLERSNMLIKLRETLLDHGSSGTSITHPGRISWFPNVAAITFAGWVSFILAVVGGFRISIEY